MCVCITGITSVIDGLAPQIEPMVDVALQSANIVCSISHINNVVIEFINF